MYETTEDLRRIYWTVGLVLAVPILTVILIELEQFQRRKSSKYRGVFRYLRITTIPLMTLWIILTQIMGYPIDDRIPRIVATVADVSAIIVGLALVNAILFSKVTEDSWQARTPKLLVDMVRLILVVIGAAMVLSFVWGVDLGQLAAALGIGSIVIGLAIAEPLGNVFAGLMLLVERPIAVGDWIKIEDEVGQVIEINWRAIHLKTYLGELVVVPNAILAKESFSNYSRPTRMHNVVVTLGFSYDDAPNKVRAILLDLLDGTPGIMIDPPATVRVTGYGDFAVDYEVIFFVEDYRRMHDVRDAFMTKVWYAARREGISIPFPTAHEYSGEEGETILAAKSNPPIMPYLKDLSILAGLSDNQRTELEAGSFWRSFAHHEVVIDQGANLPGLFLIVRGRVRASRVDIDGKDSVLFEAGPGEVFGESIAHGTRLSESKVTALEDIECIVVKPETLQHVLMSAPRFAREVSHITEIRHAGHGSRVSDRLLDSLGIRVGGGATNGSGKTK